MLKKFIAWIDSFGDCINPIVVREMRRYAKRYNMEAFLFVYAFWISSVAVWGQYSTSDSVVIDVGFVLLPTCVVLCIIGILFGLLTIASVFEEPFKDEMFFMNSLSPRQFLHAYVCLSTLWSSLIFSLALFPFVIFSILDGFLSFLTIWKYCFPLLLLTVLSSQLISLIYISIQSQLTSYGLTHKSTLFESAVTCLLVLAFIPFVLLIPLALAIFLWIGVFNLAAIDIQHGFEFISFYFLLPIGILIEGIAAYRLSLNGFKTNYRPNLSKVFYNIFCLSNLNIFMAILYVGIAVIYFYFT
jgi:hypothetical protein